MMLWDQISGLQEPTWLSNLNILGSPRFFYRHAKDCVNSYMLLSHKSQWVMMKKINTANDKRQRRLM